jgi:DNA helicase-2/ATP-dependent DNA helicase PcrA
MDEERRLCYVGMTRAMKTLSLTYANKRFIHGQSFYSLPSRFLEEIPKKYLNYIKNPSTIGSHNSAIKYEQNFSPVTRKKASRYSIGQVVRHAKFGLGTIVNYEGSGDSTRLQIKFKKAGTKWLISSYAKLEVI